LKTRYTATALQQIEQVLDHVAERSSKGAARISGRLEATVDLLARHPHAGQMTSRDGVRRVVLTPYPYLIYYRVGVKEIVIMRFRHAARKPLHHR